MAEDSMALIELMQKADGGDFRRSLAETVLQLLMEADVDGMIGAIHGLLHRHVAAVVPALEQENLEYGKRRAGRVANGIGHPLELLVKHLFEGFQSMRRSISPRKQSLRLRRAAT